jgi:hypothetical protein
MVFVSGSAARPFEINEIAALLFEKQSPAH